MFVGAPPWTFTAPAGGVSLTMTDAFFSGDAFSIFDFGVLVGETPFVAAAVDCGSDPVVCLGHPQVSHAVFSLTAGPHSITIIPIDVALGAGSAYFRVDASAVNVIPEPATLLLLGTGLAGVALKVRQRRKAQQS